MGTMCPPASRQGPLADTFQDTIRDNKRDREKRARRRLVEVESSDECVCDGSDTEDEQEGRRAAGQGQSRVGCQARVPAGGQASFSAPWPTFPPCRDADIFTATNGQYVRPHDVFPPPTGCLPFTPPFDLFQKHFARSQRRRLYIPSSSHSAHSSPSPADRSQHGDDDTMLVGTDGHADDANAIAAAAAGPASRHADIPMPVAPAIDAAPESPPFATASPREPAPASTMEAAASTATDALQAQSPPAATASATAAAVASPQPIAPDLAPQAPQAPSLGPAFFADILRPARRKATPPVSAALDASYLPAMSNGVPPPAPMDNGLHAAFGEAPFGLDQQLMAAATNGWLPNLDQPMDDAADAYTDAPLATTSGAAQERVTAFARLRFDDGSYYMRTYQIILGRDVERSQQDMRRLKLQSQANGHGSVPPRTKKRKRKHTGGCSVISQTGGIVNASVEAMPMEYQQRRQSMASQSQNSGPSQQQDSNSGGPEVPEPEHVPQDMIMKALPELPASFYQPENPSDCPVVPIHPQQVEGKSGPLGPKGISRRHAKIYYDWDEGRFLLKVLGANGLHHRGEYLRKDEVIELEHGDGIQIGLVNVHFYLPEIALTEGQRQRQDSGSRPMSFSFDNDFGSCEESDELGSNADGVNPQHLYYQVSSDELDEGDNGHEDVARQTEMHDEQPSGSGPKPKQSLKLKITNKTQKPPPKKQGKNAQKGKEPARKPSPQWEGNAFDGDVDEDDDEMQPPPKKLQKPNKGKTAANKLPASKSSTKEPQVSAASKEEELADPAEHENPPTANSPEDGKEFDGDGLITQEIARRHNLPDILIGSCLEQRKGPGRPPKDGVMSKRQRGNLIKKAKEMMKARDAGYEYKEPDTPVAKTNKPPRQDSNASKPDEDNVSEEENNVSQSPEKKKAKQTKPARTPSPELREEDFTPDQLTRPVANYVVLIHEAISSSKTGTMNLQQIYSYIERHYPWFKFKVTTSGWQSSVRHNLSQHDAFGRADREGKGWTWKINPEVSIEKERRKRQASPVATHPASQGQAYYPHPNGYPYHQPGQPPPPAYPGVHPQGGQPSSSMQSRNVHAPLHMAPNVQGVQPRLPPSLARNAATPAPQAASGASPYSSPWAAGSGPSVSSPANRPHYYPPPHTQPSPPVGQGPTPNGQYGVLFPTSASSSSAAAYGTSGGGHGGQHVTAGPGSHAAPPTTNAPYSSNIGGQAGHYATAAHIQHYAAPVNGGSQPSGTREHVPGAGHSPHTLPSGPAPANRYEPRDYPSFISDRARVSIAAFREQLNTTKYPVTTVDNAINAYLGLEDAPTHLTEQEEHIRQALSQIPVLQEHANPQGNNKGKGLADPQMSSNAPMGTAAAIAAGVAANLEVQQIPVNRSNAAQRPSVEPLTPLPGSPAMQNGSNVNRTSPLGSATQAGMKAEEGSNQ